MENIENILAETISETVFENKTYIVGGYVRDQILGNESDDLDLLVEMKAGGRKLAQFLFEKGVSSRPVIFNRFGTAQVLIDGHKIEMVMTRKENYYFQNRKPEVEFGSLQEDICRRDFTINTLIKNVVSGDIIDLTGKGKTDIEAKIIRATAEPEEIFLEDPLRMLRAIRFKVQLGFTIEEKTRAGIEKQAASLKNISSERIRDELIKILLSERSEEGIKLLIKCGLMDFIIPEVNKLAGLEQNKFHHKDALGHTLEVLSKVPSHLELRLAALLHDIAKPLVRSKDEKGIHFYKHEIVGEKITRKILNRLKFPKSIIREICFLVRNHMKLKQFGDNLENLKDKTIRRFRLEMGSKLENLLKLIHADNLSHAVEFRLCRQVPNFKQRLEKINNDQQDFKLPINGKDIMLHFEISSGKKVGKILKKAKEIWLENPDWDKQKILEYLQKRRKHV